MKKFISIMIMTVVFGGCSTNDESEPKFTAEEQEVLQVFNGVFKCEEPNAGGGIHNYSFIFEPFNAPIPKKSTVNDVPIKFSGRVTYYYHYPIGHFDEPDHEMFVYYFYVDTTKKQIVAYAVIDEKEDYFNPMVGKRYDYTIVDENTIKIFDTDLSDPLIQTRTYKRVIFS